MLPAVSVTCNFPFEYQSVPLRRENECLRVERPDVIGVYWLE